jgi:hypothetical protein
MLRLGRAVLSGLGLCIVVGGASGARADDAVTEPFELVPIFAADSVATPSTWPATAPATLPAPIIVESPAPPPRRYRRVVVEEEAPSDVEFARGHFELSLVGQGYTAYRHGGDDTIVFANVSLAYYVADGLSIGVEGGVAPGTFRNHRHHDNHNDDDGVRPRRNSSSSAGISSTAAPCRSMAMRGSAGFMPTTNSPAAEGKTTGWESPDWGQPGSWRIIGTCAAAPGMPGWKAAAAGLTITTITPIAMAMTDSNITGDLPSFSER